MSPHLNYEIARARQAEIAASVTRAHRLDEPRVPDGPGRRSIRSRLGHAAVAVGVCIAIATAVTVTGASATQRPAKAGGHLSVTQLNRQIRALEAKGYVPASCTTRGTLLRDANGQSKTINW